MSLPPFFAPRFWRLWPSLLALRLAVSLPHWGRMWVGRWVGAALYRLAAKRRRIAQVNLALCLPELSAPQRQRILRRHFDALGKALIETGMSYWCKDEELVHLSHVEGTEHLRAALQHNKGVILLSAHFTLLELSVRFLLARKEFKVCCLYQRHKNPLFEAVISYYRNRHMEQLVAHDNVRQMLRLLRENKIVWYATDQGYSGKYAELVPFFGIPACSNTSLSRLAKLSGAKVVPFLATRQADGCYAVELRPALDDFPSESPAQDTARYHQLIEQHARQVPDQYLWVHRRFKGRPPEFPDVYNKV